MHQQKLPNATISLILGIFSILLCWCYLIPSLLLGTIAIILANRDTKRYRENPSEYSNYGNVQAGKITGIIGIVLAILFVAYLIYVLNAAGITLEDLKDMETLQEKLEEFKRGA